MARALLLPFGVAPANSFVTLDDSSLRVAFGPFGMETGIENLTGFETSGGYRWYRAVGLRLSLTDNGVTFGTNTDRGLCVRFDEPIEKVVPVARGRHPGMTVTVADVEALAAALTGSGVPRTDQ